MTDREIVILLVAAVALVLYLIFRNPFRYPYFTYTFDVTGKRNINFENYIDTFLCNPINWRKIWLHEGYIREWKKEKEEYIRRSKLRALRKRQYQKVLDDGNAYRFRMVRNKTRYVQRNYVKTPYKVAVTSAEWVTDWYSLENRYKELQKIGFEATLNEYNSKEQRKLMTPELRRKIKERDRYTCQICGKYMPDEVGLHIDHIVPVSRGGKSVPSNLRVLCSKCNGRKGAK